MLQAVIATRPELLVALYKDVSPVLISRFGDREETVRVEVWATYGVLLTQTAYYGNVPQAKDAEYSVGGKRKREEGMDVEDSPAGLLRNQVPSLAKSLLYQLKSAKTTPSTLQAGFTLLHTLLTVLPGSLGPQAPQVIVNAKTVLSQSATSSSSTLQVTCLSFLALFFSSHAPPTYAGSLDSIIPVLLKTVADRHPRLASESFRVFSALLNSVKPIIVGTAWVERVYAEAVNRLSNHDTDAEVRACAEEAIGDLWICATDIVKTKDRKEWEAMCRSSGRIDGAVKVVTRVAREVEIGDDWVNGCVEWILTLLKRSGRAGKNDVFSCLDALLKRSVLAFPCQEHGDLHCSAIARYSVVPDDLPPTLIDQLKHYIATTDIALLAQALNIVSLLLEIAPAPTFPEVERELLKDIYEVAHSPLISGASFDSVLEFFAALVQADMQIATHVVPNLVISIERASKPEASQSNVARCIGQVVKCQLTVAAGTVAEFAKHLKV